MSSIDEFIHISTGLEPAATSSHQSGVLGAFFGNTHGDRWYTEGVIAEAIRKKYPKHLLAVNPAYTCDLLAFAQARNDAIYFPRKNGEGLSERLFLPPMRRYNDENGGAFGDRVIMGSFDYMFQDNKFILYVVEGHDGMMAKTKNNYILVAPETEGEEMSITEKASAQKKVDSLLAAGTKWMGELHDEVLVFDQGFWQKNRDLWENIKKSNWEDVILEKEKKDAIIEDVNGFFDAEERYAEFGVPWKRGVIFYGPPGNGKTISTKALMHDVSKRLKPSVESLYVKTFNSYLGPEYGIRQIFLRARQMAPCLLIFEDIDSLVSPGVRSYFLNEVDGLESNHGILMIGSTNHLERLDPGIAKRPSRFDRKYFFDVPSRDERIQYCDYWRNKLKNNKKIDFPKEMSVRVADITTDFSFAYMKEAFVAALLVIVARKEERGKYRYADDNLSGNVLWKELKKQISALRDEMENESEDSSSSIRSEVWPVMSGILPYRGSSATQPMDIGNSHVMPRYG